MKPETDQNDRCSLNMKVVRTPRSTPTKKKKSKTDKIKPIDRNEDKTKKKKCDIQKLCPVARHFTIV